MFKIVLTDCDGCLTDGKLIYLADGSQAKNFHAHDGVGFFQLQDEGIETGIVTCSKATSIIDARAKTLHCTHVSSGVHERSKEESVRKILNKSNLTWDDLAYLGDDVADIPVLRKAKLAFCPADARKEVKQVEGIKILSLPGGSGCFREMTDILLENISYGEDSDEPEGDTTSDPYAYITSAVDRVIPKADNKPGRGRRHRDDNQETKETKSDVTHVTISPGGAAYHSHTWVQPAMENLESFNNLQDIHCKGVLEDDTDEDKRLRLKSWYDTLTHEGTVFCIVACPAGDKELYKDLFESSGLVLKSIKDVRSEIHIKAFKHEFSKDTSNTGKKGFIWTSPYGGCWPEKCFAQSGKEKAYSSKIKNISMFKSVCTSADVDLLIMGNFIKERNLIKREAIKRGIDVIHGEDGFMPHYSTLHVDPIGFCWESSLPTMTFRGEVLTDHHNLAAEVIANVQEGIGNNPFNSAHKNILVPLQLLGDRVNRHGLNLQGWEGMLDHIRQTLPEDVHMHIKKHPRSGQEVIASIKKWSRENDNAHLYEGDIKAALYHCDGVIGSNSTVLTEARLLYNRPTWAYGNSWYTNHTALVNRINLDLDPMELINVDHIEKGIPEDEYLSEYRLWYIGQLMARQHVRPKTKLEKENFIKWMLRRTYNSYKEHGEDIFGLEGIPLR